jgi:ankyrin repeat protein
MNIFDAIENGDFYQVRACLKAGEDVNQIGRGGLTPLMQACCSGNPDLVRMLIKDYNADVNMVNSKGYSPLLWSSMLGELVVASILIREFGADVNKASTDGTTPIIIATRLNCIHIIHLLIAAGADLDACDFCGKTAYDIALEKENDAMVALLQPPELNNLEGDLPFAETLECVGAYITFIYDLL